MSTVTVTCTSDPKAGMSLGSGHKDQISVGQQQLHLPIGLARIDEDPAFEGSIDQQIAQLKKLNV